jgi:hypothetical protein
MRLTTGRKRLTREVEAMKPIRDHELFVRL